MIAFVKVAIIATAMAIVGVAVLPIQGSVKLDVLPRIVVASNVLWFLFALVFERRRASRKWALEVGAASPFLGAVLVGLLFPNAIPHLAGAQPLFARLVQSIMFHLWGVAVFFWVCIPVGIATGYLVHRVLLRKAQPA